ncbi:MAG: ABC transporter permease [Ruminococcus flavefaciens]|nr:ABC transporter permease [Ruminococcus flavefaciens]MCM1058879.1 ABC transporter permease [Eubacterium sp.]
MNDENNFGGSPLDDIEYSAQPKNEGPQRISAPVLDEIDYVAPTAKKGGPQGVSAPVLDDMGAYVPNEQKKGAPTGVNAPILDSNDDFAAEPEKVVMTDEEIIAGFTADQLETFNRLPAVNKQKVLDLRRAQLGVEAPPPIVTAPVLDEDNYIPSPEKTAEPPKFEEPVKAPVLDEEPKPPKYVPKFVDEDLERAKQEGAKKAVSSQLSSNQKDSKESLRMMLQLKEERQAEMAAKGFRISILLAVIGIISAVLFYLLYSGQLGLTYKDGLSGIGKIIENSAMYIAITVGICSVTLITGISGFKSLSSLVFLLLGVIQIFPGIIMIPQHNGSMALTAILYGAALVGTIVVFFMLSASESVGLFFKKNKN